MNKVFSALDAIIGPIPDEVSTSITESPETLDSMGAFLIPAIALVIIATIGIIIFSKNKKTEN